MSQHRRRPRAHTLKSVALPRRTVDKHVFTIRWTPRFVSVRLTASCEWVTLPEALPDREQLTPTPPPHQVVKLNSERWEVIDTVVVTHVSEHYLQPERPTTDHLRLSCCTSAGSNVLRDPLGGDRSPYLSQPTDISSARSEVNLWHVSTQILLLQNQTKVRNLWRNRSDIYLLVKVRYTSVETVPSHTSKDVFRTFHRSPGRSLSLVSRRPNPNPKMTVPYSASPFRTVYVSF